MSNEIIGNVEYKSITEKAYINGAHENIRQLAKKLDSENISFSGRINNYRATITVNKRDLEIANRFMNEIKESNPKRRYIGNIPYGSITDKRILSGETNIMEAVSIRLTRDKIDHSGVIEGNITRITVSGNSDLAILRKYIELEKKRNSIEVIYKLARTVDAYYISEMNSETNEEISMLKNGNISVFFTVDEATQYAQSIGISLSNDENELNEWRKIEAETKTEKERIIIFNRNQELINQLTMTESGYEEQFVFNESSIDWIYFNPDGADGKGQIVITTLYPEDIIEAYKARTSVEDYNQYGQRAFIEILQNGNQSLIDADTEDFEEYILNFINIKDDEHIIKSSPVIAQDNYDSNLESIIDHLENHFEDVRNFKAKNEYSPVGNHTFDENLPLSEQLLNIAQKELDNFEKSLDTVEKVKLAAYELVVKRDILSYIEYDLSENITDSDVEAACENLIKSGYPLDTIYQDWQKNEYDNRMEAIRMTTTDTIQKEITRNINNKSSVNNQKNAVSKSVDDYSPQISISNATKNETVKSDLNSNDTKNDTVESELNITNLTEVEKESALKTVANQYNSFLILQDIIYVLHELQDDSAENYDWNNYAQAFKSVLDCNIKTDIALPLFKSGTDKIFLSMSTGKEITADEISLAISSLEIVLQNSHLLRNPEEKNEQITFFDTISRRKSSDEIVYQLQQNTDIGKNYNDFTITDENYVIESGAKARFANNIEAIKLLKSIENEKRHANPEEQKILAKYIGWGGLSEAFDSRKPNWNNEYRELKNLLTTNEYKAARASTMNAHYTTPVVINAIYTTLKNLGFDGGKIIEPALGTGNFFGAMPENMRDNSTLYGVELDDITGRIAQQLYPSANILIKGYENTNFKNDSMDVAVGNVPFGNYKVNDKAYNKQNLLIHDYFFEKTLDKVRAGGIIAFVTSKGTMDKENSDIRKYLAERAELLGAIRLPNNAFKKNAGTEVTSDIIFLQKRERAINIEKNPPEWIYKGILPNGIAVNKYFVDHPEMILGEMVEGNKLYGNQTDASMCIAIEGANLSEQLAEAVKNITGTYKNAEKKTSDVLIENSDNIICPPDAPLHSYIVQDDIVYFHKSAGTLEKVNDSENNIERIKAMIQLCDSVHKLFDLQINNTDGDLDAEITEMRKTLNNQYDDFSKKHGLINSIENKKAFSRDNGYHLIKSLEVMDNNGNYIEKADIFRKNTINPNIAVTHCDNAQDALILSLSEKMCVNFDYMSILTGKSEDELIAELGDKIYQNPQQGMRWESADEYLTGNIRTKLAAAETEGLTRNVEALRAVIPERIEAADIAAKLGSAWIDPEYIKQFIINTLKPDFVTSKKIEVTYTPAIDKWKVDGWEKAYANTLTVETYGTQDINAYEIIESTLNMQKVEIKERVKDEYGDYVRDKNGRYVYKINPQKTMIAQSKQEELKRAFSDWIFSDPDRREKLVSVYNEKFNSIRLREYDGTHLNFVGMSSKIILKEHQRNAIARGLYSNSNTLIAHEVGAGKTYEMIAIAMEGKRLGLHNKSLIAVPKGLVEQWGKDFRSLYPNANVLVATEDDFKQENRRDLFAKIATGDWDAVIIGHSQFDKIQLSRERELDYLNNELNYLESALADVAHNGEKDFTVKKIEKSIKNYKTQMERLLEKTPEDDVLCFEKLGVDKIFVDESQAYKNLVTPTKMKNVSGLGSVGSGRAMQLLMKCKYLDELTGGKGVVFASGTPISNSMSEMYTLMRYLQANKLAETGINSFDRWASIFGETVTSMELSPEGNGKYQMKTRFAKFQNLPELMNIFKECADIKTAESLNLERPDFEMHNVVVPATAIQSEMIKELGERAKAIRNGSVKPTEDNMCKLTVDGRKIGLDQRCINAKLPDEPKSKVNICINNVYDIWQRTAAERSTQLIFCDLATPQATLNENTCIVYRKNEDGDYSAVYTSKLNEKDTAEKILKKINGKKPPKNFELGSISDGDIVMLKKVDYTEETLHNLAYELKEGKLVEISPEMWDKLHQTPTEFFESERKFCVYDDIKQKLIAKGVPEKEIAFIHDYDKKDDREKAYQKLNYGEVRVLIGSTLKCGAGMNAQERMIALHDLDAPMRPSDMAQRHGRIIRRGNLNKKVDIYRYTTDKTFDAYLYQMLENKQRFISQIMTDKSPIRSCEDVDEIALDYAEVKALCAGNPLIKEKIDLETEITKLNVLKSAFLSQKYSLQDKAYKTLPEHQKYTTNYIEKLKVDIEKVQSVKPLINEHGKSYYPIVVNDTEYHDKEEAGQAIRSVINENLKSNLGNEKEHTIGSYRGLEMRAYLDTHSNVHCMRFNLKGACDHYGELNMDMEVKASGNIIRFDNIINSINLELQKQEDRLQSITADFREAMIAAQAVFPQEQEITDKEKRLAVVNTLLSSTETHTDNSTRLYAALVEICPELENNESLYCKYEEKADSGIEPLVIDKFGNTVLIAHTYIQNGDLMYDPAIEFLIDVNSRKAQVLTYELSNLGIFEDFCDGNHIEKRTEVEELALNVMFENIKSYEYTRTEFRACDTNDKETEKNNDDFII